jgi:very-short-patch-repair endonuclease
VWNQPLPGADDLIPDGYIEEVRLVLEVESMEHHQFGDAPERTERRRARLASLGWRVYPVSPRRLRESPAAVLAEIEAAAHQQ